MRLLICARRKGPTTRDTLTGGRVKRLEESLRGQTFMVTYGDGVSNIDINALLKFHKSCGRLAILTAVRPPARFGAVIFDGDLLSRFSEKPQAGEGWVNGGCLVMEPAILAHFLNDKCTFVCVGHPSFFAGTRCGPRRRAMLVTNDEELHRRVLVLRDHGRQPGDKMFFNAEVGHKYKMSSLQAVLGLAKLERIENLVTRKREIFT